MEPTRVEITVLGEGGPVVVPAYTGEKLAGALIRGAILTGSPCGGRGTCGRCLVEVVEGPLTESDPMEIRTLTRIGAGERGRLACRAVIEGPLTLEVRGRGRVAASVGVDASQKTGAGTEVDDVPLIALVDMGSTTISVRLVDEEGHHESATRTPNSQAEVAADVMSRIERSLYPEGARELTEAIRRSVTRALTDAALAAGVRSGSITRILIAGNPTSTGTFLGSDVSSLAVAPYTMPDLTTTSFEAGMLLGPDFDSARVDVMPLLVSHVGGDAYAAAVALASEPAPHLIVDLGTNTELILDTGETLYVASTPAGSALDLAGSYASELFETMLDLLERGSLTHDGVLVEGSYEEVSVMRTQDGILTVTHPALPYAVSQLQIRDLQLAIGAVHAGADALLETAGLPAPEVTIHLAGALVTALDRTIAERIGLLSSGAGDIIPAGELVLDGLQKLHDLLAHGSVSMEEAAATLLRRELVHVDLATRASFMQELIAVLRFPGIQ